MYTANPPPAMLRPGVQTDHDAGDGGQPGIPMVMITQNGQRIVMPASDWHRMHVAPQQQQAGYVNGGPYVQSQAAAAAAAVANGGPTAMTTGVHPFPPGVPPHLVQHAPGRMVMVPSGMQVSSAGLHGQNAGYQQRPTQQQQGMYVPATPRTAAEVYNQQQHAPTRPTIMIPGTGGDPTAGEMMDSQQQQQQQQQQGHVMTPQQQMHHHHQLPTPVFRTPQPPTVNLLPPSWNKPPAATSTTTTMSTPTAPTGGPGQRTPVSAGPASMNGAQGKVSFLPPRALQQHQGLHPAQQQQQQQQVMMASPAQGTTALGTPAQPIDLDSTREDPPMQGPASTPGYRLASGSSVPGTPGGASLALLGMQGMAPPPPPPPPSQAAVGHQQQGGHESRGMQTVYLPNGQSMVIMRQTPPSPHPHPPHQQHQTQQQQMATMAQGVQQQMHEWRRGVMMPGIEVGQGQWGEVPDVGSCLLPGEASGRLSAFAQALRDTSVTRDLAVWKALVARFFSVGAMVYYSLTHQGNQSTKTFDIPHCSIARWFRTLFDAENVLVALEIHDPTEEYVFTDYADPTYQQLVRGTRVESQRVCWIYRNRETGHIVRTFGWLRAVMTPDFAEGVLKMERLEVCYQLAEEFVPRHVAAAAGRLDQRDKPEQDPSGGSPMGPGENADDRGEQVAGYEGMVRRRNLKATMDMPPPLGPYGVTEQVLRFLELATTMLALRTLMERSRHEMSNPRDTLKRAVADMRNSSADGSDSVDAKSIIGTPASNLLTINGTLSYLGPAEAHDQQGLEPPRDPSATPAPDQKPNVSPLTSVPATPKTKQLPAPSVPHSGPPSASTGTSTLPSPSSKAMPPPKLVMNLKRKNPVSTNAAGQADEDAVRPSKKTAPSPKIRRKNAEKARAEPST